MPDRVPDEWLVRCRRCGTWRYVPTLARDCEKACGSLGVDWHPTLVQAGHYAA